MNGLPDVEHQELTEQAARAVVWARCMGRCEACGGSLNRSAWACHHRLLRSARRADVPLWCPCRLLALHHACHNVAPGSVHQEVARSRASGHLVSRYAEPAHVPADLPLGVRVGLSNPVTLTCGGTYA